MLQYRVGLFFGAATVAGEEHKHSSFRRGLKRNLRRLFWPFCICFGIHGRSGTFGGLVVDIRKLHPSIVIIIVLISTLTDH